VGEKEFFNAEDAEARRGKTGIDRAKSSFEISISRFSFRAASASLSVLCG